MDWELWLFGVLGIECWFGLLLPLILKLCYTSSFHSFTLSCIHLIIYSSDSSHLLLFSTLSSSLCTCLLFAISVSHSTSLQTPTSSHPFPRFLFLPLGHFVSVCVNRPLERQRLRRGNFMASLTDFQRVSISPSGPPYELFPRCVQLAAHVHLYFYFKLYNFISSPLHMGIESGWREELCLQLGGKWARGEGFLCTVQ